MTLDSLTIKLGVLKFHIGTKLEGKFPTYRAPVVFERAEETNRFHIRFDAAEGIFIDNPFIPCKERFFTASEEDIEQCRYELNSAYNALLTQGDIVFPDDIS